MRAGKVTKKKMKNTKIIGILIASLVIIGAFSLILFSDSFSTSVKDSEPIEQNNENNSIDSQTKSENSDGSEDFDKILDYNDGTPRGDRVEKEGGYGNIIIRVSYPVTSLNGNSMFILPIPYTRIYLESDDGNILRIGITNLLGYKVFRFIPMDHDYVITAYKKNYRNTETFVAMTKVTDVGFVNINLK